ncbi:hypothetical protein [Desertivirga arenae]|uniref:hypothetical protein n=1 Tax=Desertivirga arenae TaxID=2810309 RepID=UPI001A96E047|nr:hypothetical protein [Pedobacter sp. SYSU D00823]
MREQSKRTSKYPPAFNIDVHIDDSFGLKIEGDRYNFATIIIKEDDDGWQKTVLERLQSYSRHRI